MCFTIHNGQEGMTWRIWLTEFRVVYTDSAVGGCKDTLPPGDSRLSAV